MTSKDQQEQFREDALDFYPQHEDVMTEWLRSGLRAAYVTARSKSAKEIARLEETIRQWEDSLPHKALIERNKSLEAELAELKKDLESHEYYKQVLAINAGLRDELETLKKGKTGTIESGRYTYSWDDSGHWTIITPDLRVFLTWEEFEGSEDKVKLIVNSLNEYCNCWISVNDRLPDTEALLLTSSGLRIIGDWYKDAWRTHLSKWVENIYPEKIKGTHILMSAFKKEEITHWRPLPQPPKQN